MSEAKIRLVPLFKYQRAGRPQILQQRRPIGTNRFGRPGAHHHRGGTGQPAQVLQAKAQQPARLRQRHTFIVKRVEQIQHQHRAVRQGFLLQQRQGLVAGEGPRNADARQRRFQLQGQAAQGARHRQRVELVATIQHPQRTQCGQAGRQLQHTRLGGMAGNHQPQTAGHWNRNYVHIVSIPLYYPNCHFFGSEFKGTLLGDGLENKKFSFYMKTFC